MRKQKSVVAVLRGLMKLIEEEAARNPSFAQQLEELLPSTEPKKRSTATKRKAPVTQIPLPDIHAERRRRGPLEFALWLKEQPPEVLRALIKNHDFDPSRRTSRWRDPEKLSGFISEQLESRMGQG